MPKASLKAAEKYFVVAKPVFVAMPPTERSVSHSRAAWPSGTCPYRSCAGFQLS